MLMLWTASKAKCEQGKTMQYGQTVMALQKLKSPVPYWHKSSLQYIWALQAI